MRNTQNFKTLSLITLGMTALSAINPSQSYGQGKIYETTANLNLREGVGTNYNIILTMKKGSKLEVLEFLGSWAKVKYNGYVGYVSKQYLKEVENISENPDADNESTIKTMNCTGDSVNVRTGPSTSERVIGKLNKGDKVQVIYTTSRGWSRIKYNNGYAYVSSQYLSEKVIEKPSNPGTSDKITIKECKATSLNVRSGPSTADNLIGIISKGNKVEVLEDLNNGWSRIKYNGSSAYVSSQYLVNVSNDSSNNQNKMKCNANILNVRSGPTTKDAIIGKLKKGDIVVAVYEVSTGWMKIEYNGGYGYVSTEYLTYI